MIDYYKILGISEDASEDEIKKAHRILSHKYHPDSNEKKSDYERRVAEEEFKRVQNAYEKIEEELKNRKLENTSVKQSFSSTQSTNNMGNSKETNNEKQTNSNNSDTSEEDQFFQSSESNRWKKWRAESEAEATMSEQENSNASGFSFDFKNPSNRNFKQQILNLVQQILQWYPSFIDPNIEIFDYLIQQSSFFEDYSLKHSYQKFLKIFQQFWDIIYDEICKMEIKNFRNNNYQNINDDILSINYSDFDDNGNIWGNIHLSQFASMFNCFSNIISDEDCNFIFDSHLKMMTKLNLIDMAIDNISKKERIFYFFPVSRLNLFYQKYLNQISNDVRSGIRLGFEKEECKQYIMGNLKIYNKYAQLESYQYKYHH